MLLNKFNNGTNYTIGVELELRILNKKTLHLQNEYDYIFENISDKYKKNISGEFLDSMLEINTPVFKKPSEITLYLQDIKEQLNKIAKNKDFLFTSSGAYSLKNSNVQMRSINRYKEIFDEHKILLKNFTICGLHVHVGFENFNEALKAFNFSIQYLPLFVALSASSLFYDNENTGIHSFRTKVFERLPKGSLPQYFDSYEQMKELYDTLYLVDVIKSEKDIWWDLRIQPDLKTLEFRVCDAVHDIKRVEAIVSLIQGICKLAKTKEFKKVPMQILKQNMWSATRYSMDANMIVGNKSFKIKEFLNILVDELIKKDLIFSKELVLEYIKKDSIAQEMQKLYLKHSNLNKIEKVGEFR